MERRQHDGRRGTPWKLSRSLALSLSLCAASGCRSSSDGLGESSASLTEPDREAALAELDAAERGRLRATERHATAVERLRARQTLANEIVNEREGIVPTGERRPELTAVYEERYRHLRRVIVEDAPAEDWEEIADEGAEAARRFEPLPGDEAVDRATRDALAREGLVAEGTRR